MGAVLAKAAGVDFAVQWAGFLIAALIKKETFYDLFGGSTFVLLSALSLKWGNTYHLRQKISSACVALWGTRLSWFLYSRISKDGKDRRFDGVRDKPAKFFVFWTIQAVWVFLTMLPVLILNSNKEDEELTWRDYLGWFFWVLGFVIEVVADRQKQVFRANSANHTKFITTGLWSISRHPNYLGEIMLWCGLFLPCTSVMKGTQYLSVISPMFVTYLLTRVSGVPLLERAAKKRWGNNPAWQKYTRLTPVLVPRLW